MKTLIWLDDLRDPHTENWLRDYAPSFTEDDEIIWVKNYDDFVECIEETGMPDMICFDHDLGEDIARNKVFYGMSKKQARAEKKLAKSGYDAAKWLTIHCMREDIDLPDWNVQSANPVGRENINGILNSYKKFRNG